MKVDVEVVTSATAELVDGLNMLVPQLSANAAPLTLDALEKIVGSDAVTLYVARSEGQLVGSLTLVVFAIPTGWRAWIEDVVVDESSRGLGAGENLTMAAVDEARRRGARSIDLTSRPAREAANAMYRKLGFEHRDTNVYRLLLELPDGPELP
ncbi:MAG TPA: GNAT family N-acetyltransferase [Acidimicrobiales bacterium]|jgi:ribosomal protein S18 acetylase RimI-like enzyme|nr:GNAT family N-acetyltransferase [Acidimicrobiales bacterium]